MMDDLSQKQPDPDDQDPHSFDFDGSNLFDNDEDPFFAIPLSIEKLPQAIEDFQKGELLKCKQAVEAIIGPRSQQLRKGFQNVLDTLDKFKELADKLVALNLQTHTQGDYALLSFDFENLHKKYVLQEEILRFETIIYPALAPSLVPLMKAAQEWGESIASALDEGKAEARASYLEKRAGCPLSKISEQLDRELEKLAPYSKPLLVQAHRLIQVAKEANKENPAFSVSWLAQFVINGNELHRKILDQVQDPKHSQSAFRIVPEMSFMFAQAKISLDIMNDFFSSLAIAAANPDQKKRTDDYMLTSGNIIYSTPTTFMLEQVRVSALQTLRLLGDEPENIPAKEAVVSLLLTTIAFKTVADAICNDLKFLDRSA